MYGERGVCGLNTHLASTAVLQGRPLAAGRREYALLGIRTLCGHDFCIVRHLETEERHEHENATHPDYRQARYAGAAKFRCNCRMHA